MEELLASQTKKLITVFRNQPVEGEVIAISDKEIILDIGAKSEGVLPKKELSDPQLESLKVGDNLKAFVSQPENESGQVVLSVALQARGPSRGRALNWDKFTTAQNQKTKLQGAVLEVNKGGLIVEVEGSPREAGVRGFLPNSQVGFELLSKVSGGMDSFIGQTLSLNVIEVDQDNNKLIFTQRGQVSEDVKEKLKDFKNGQKTQGKIVAILPFGLVVDISGVEGLVFIADVSWEKVEDLSNDFKVGQELEVLITGIDEELGRLNLSTKQFVEDPFSKLAEKYPADEVVKAQVLDVSEAGVSFKLDDKVEGFMSAAKMESGTSYEKGESIAVLVDSIDIKRRRINLAPFITSTSGLIYK